MTHPSVLRKRRPNQSTAPHKVAQKRTAKLGSGSGGTGATTTPKSPAAPSFAGNKTDNTIQLQSTQSRRHHLISPTPPPPPPTPPPLSYAINRMEGSSKTGRAILRRNLLLNHLRCAIHPPVPVGVLKLQLLLLRNRLRRHYLRKTLQPWCLEPCKKDWVSAYPDR